MHITYRMKTTLLAMGCVLGMNLLSLPACAQNSPTHDPSVPTPTVSEISYGDHERHILDFWKAESTAPTPLVFVIHGGGWKGGTKERVNRFVDVNQLLESGISVVAINYRLMEHVPDSGITPPVKVSLHDAARALQFVRSKASEWNINKERIGAAGGSAGACSSLWLAYHDDLSNPKSEDPIARESTRLWSAAVMGAQTTLDPKQMKEWTPNSRYGGHAFGKKDFAQFLADRESILPWIAEYSPYALVSADDPPVYIVYNNPPAIGQEQKDPTHTANFGVKLQEHCESVGIECEVMYPDAPNVQHETPTDYLIASLLQPAPIQLKVTALPEQLDLDPVYTKYLSANGYPVVSIERVDDHALLEAGFWINQMLAERPDVRDAMIKSGSRMIVMAHDQWTTDVPEYAHMTPKDFWDKRARGLGGSQTDPVCSSAEENVLAFKGDPYKTESILIHEFAHNIHLRGMVNVDDTFDSRLEGAYQEAMEKGLWETKYASTNRDEYFAEGVQSWFDNNRQPDHDHNFVDTREELISYDPALAAFCKEVFGETKLVYTKPTTRLNGHLADYNPKASPTFVWPERLKELGDKIKKNAVESRKKNE